MKQLRHICQTCGDCIDKVRGRLICGKQKRYDSRSYARDHTCDDWKANPVCARDCPGDFYCGGRVKCWEEVPDEMPDEQ